MPAPAPWANTKHAVARAGFVSNAETEPALPVSMVSLSALATVITLETGSADRFANMTAFTAAALDLLMEAIEAVA